MDEKLFDELCESIKEAGEINRRGKMRKFKIGDKVRVVADFHGLEGKTGEIREIGADNWCGSKYSYRVATNDDITWYIPEDKMELVEEVKMEFVQDGRVATNDNGKIRTFDTGATRDTDEEKQYGHPRFYEILKDMAELHSRKNHDYAGTSDPLKNLRACERLELEPFMGVMVRLQDKWSRLEEFVKSGKLMVKGEGVKDTLMDNAVYSILAVILYEEQERNEDK